MGGAGRARTRTFGFNTFDLLLLLQSQNVQALTLNAEPLTPSP
jgi:hypothetical protein